MGRTGKALGFVAGLRIYGPTFGKLGVHGDIEGRFPGTGVDAAFGRTIDGEAQVGAFVGVDLPVWGGRE